MSIWVQPLRVTNSWMINYCYLIMNATANTALMIDPSWELQTIENALTQHQIQLKGILLTHHHGDHVHLAKPLALQYQIPVFMSQAEINFYDFKCPNLHPITQFEPFTLADIPIKPIFTPGHTYGGTSCLIEDNLFCGDTLFIEGCGMCFGQGSNPEILFESLQILKVEISPHTHIYPGHSYGKEPGMFFRYVLENNIYLQFNEKDAFINYRMRKNQKGLFNFQ